MNKHVGFNVESNQIREFSPVPREEMNNFWISKTEISKFRKEAQAENLMKQARAVVKEILAGKIKSIHEDDLENLVEEVMGQGIDSVVDFLKAHGIYLIPTENTSPPPPPSRADGEVHVRNLIRTKLESVASDSSHLDVEQQVDEIMKLPRHMILEFLRQEESVSTDDDLVVVEEDDDQSSSSDFSDDEDDMLVENFITKETKREKRLEPPSSTNEQDEEDDFIANFLSADDDTYDDKEEDKKDEKEEEDEFISNFMTEEDDNSQEIDERDTPYDSPITSSYEESGHEIDSHVDELSTFLDAKVEEFQGAVDEDALDSMDTPRKVVFYLYKGKGHTVPPNVTHIIVDSSVTEIPSNAFHHRTFLVHVELPENLQVIGDGAFLGCTSLVHIRIPSNVTVLPKLLFCNCRSLVSVQIPTSIKAVKDFCFWGCVSLRNVAIPASSEIGHGIFYECITLRRGFMQEDDDHDRLVWALTHRFDGLPIHELLYHHHYYHSSFQNSSTAAKNLTLFLQAAMLFDDSAMGKVDCLGMSPFHVLTLTGIIPPMNCLYNNTDAWQALLSLKLLSDTQGENKNDAETKKASFLSACQEKDSLNNSPLEYLLHYYSPQATKELLSSLR